MRKFLNALGGIMIAVFAFCIVTLVLASTHGNTFSQEIVSWFDKHEEQTEELPNDELSTTSVLRVNAAAEDLYATLYTIHFLNLSNRQYSSKKIDDMTTEWTLTANLPSADYCVKYGLNNNGGAMLLSTSATGLTVTLTLQSSQTYHTMTGSYDDTALSQVCVVVSFAKKTGYDLEGVYSDASFSTAYTPSTSSSVSSSTYPLMYPKYVLQQFTVEFNTNGAGTVDAQLVNYGAIAELPELEREGYIFQGWLDDTGATYVDAPIYQNIVLTAKWAPKIVTVKLYVADTLYGSVDVEYGTKVSDVLEELNLKYCVVESTTNFKDEELQTLRSHDELTQDVKLYVRDQTDLDKVDTFVTSYWYVFVAVAAFAILGIVLGFTQKKKKRGYRR